MKSTLDPKVTITLTPPATRATRLAHCGYCDRETYVLLTLSADHPECCRRCFRANVGQIRRSRSPQAV